jgi:ABC-type branched-subunit amino acid transport system substrate-binding protein
MSNVDGSEDGRASVLTRRRLLKTAAGGAFAAMAGPALAACGGSGGAASGGSARAAKVGILADMTGSLAVFGKSYWNAARMAAEDINKSGGVRGRKIQLVLADSASDNSTAVQKSGQLVQQDHVDVVIGGLTSAMREAIKSTIIDRGQTLYIYPNLYEGNSCGELQFNTGPVPPMVVDPLVPWLFQNASGKNVYYTGSDYVFPRASLKFIKAAVESNGGKLVGTEFLPLDATDFSHSTQKILSSGADIVYSNVIPPGIWTQVRQLTEQGFRDKGMLCVPYLEESALQAIPAKLLEGLPACLDFFQALTDPYDTALVKRYKSSFHDGTYFSANGAVGTFRGLKMWAQAANEADSLDAHDVAKALDHQELKEGPGGPAKMVPGSHHVAVNMYLGVAHNGKMDIKENFGQRQPGSAGCHF